MFHPFVASHRAALHKDEPMSETANQCRNCLGEFGYLSWRTLCVKCERQKIELEAAERERLRTAQWHMGPMSPEDAARALEAMPAHIPRDHPDLVALRKIAGPLADRPELAKGTPSGNGEVLEDALEAPIEFPELMTLSTAAILVGRTLAGLRHYRRRGMPKPYVRGKKGQPHEYKVSEMKPWLEKTFNRSIPDVEIRKFRHEH
jgi:hypothetical protein